MIELEDGAREPPPDLDWADLAGDDQWQIEPPPDPESSVPEQGWLF